MWNKQQEPSNRSGGRGLFFAVVLAAVWWVGSAPALAQAVYGSIFGTVTDKTGAVVPNATVTVVDVSKGTSVTVIANESGLYRVQHLIPDTYQVTVEAGGYSKSIVENVVVYADTAPEVDVKLEVGAVSNSVTVTSAIPLLETDRAEVSTIFDSRAVENLPNFNRNFTSFELLTPGTSYIGWSVGEGSGNPQRSQQIEVNGQLPFATGYELDGTDNQEPINGVAVINPNLDAVSDMKVRSQNYDAEFGKAVAGLVTAQTKSGSNTMHGTAFEYRRSDAQQARDPFSNQSRSSLTGRYLAPTLHNQFGGSLGGPIIRERLFYFVDYQGLREKTGSSTLTTVPTAAALNSCTASTGYCDLSDYISAGLQAYKPNSMTDGNNSGRTAYSNNQIPVSDLSSASVAFFKLLPSPNTGSTGQILNNYSASGAGTFSTDQPDIRIDDQTTEHLHLFGRYTYFGGSLSGDPYFGQAGGAGFGSGGFAGSDDFHYHSVAAGGDYIVSPTWLTDFRFGYYRIYNNTAGPDSTSALGNNLGIPNANLTPLSLYGGMPQFNIDSPTASGVNGGSNLEYGTSANAGLQQTSQYQFVNNWSHQIGNHNIKFGGDYRYGKNNSLALSGSGNVLRSGTYFFYATRTSGTAASSGTTATSPGLGFATFLLGDTSVYWRTVSQTVTGQTHQHRFFLYAQDQWRATPKMTVNYGIRWEYYSPEAVDGKGQGGLLNIDEGYVAIAGYGKFSNSLGVEANKKAFAPRLGVTYQLFPKTVVRAGYGLVYGQGWSGNTFGSVLTGSIPLQVEQDIEPSAYTASVFNLSADKDSISAGPPTYTFPTLPSDGQYTLPNGVSQTARPMKMRLPTVAGWNLTVQHELTSTLSVQLSYVGSQAYHNMFDSSNQFNANEATLTGYAPIDGTTYTLNQRRPYYDGTAQQYLGVKGGVAHGWTQSISYNYNEATESYNALQAVVNKRVSAGLSFLAHYTWSHAIDHESYQFLIDPAIGRGNSYYNRRQAFVFAGDYDLPFGKDKMFGSNLPRWTQQVVGGFQLNGTLSLMGGLPFTPSYNEGSEDNDVGAADGAVFLNKTGSGFHAKKGSYNATGNYVPYLPTSPYSLGQSSLGEGNPSSWGAYSRPAVGTWGNLGRNSLWGPGMINVDSTLSKNIDIWEKVKMQLSVQAYNTFNHTNLGNPNTCIDCQTDTAGAITSTVASQDGTSMRRLQFAARFTF